MVSLFDFVPYFVIGHNYASELVINSPFNVRTKSNQRASVIAFLHKFINLSCIMLPNVFF